MEIPAIGGGGRLAPPSEMARRAPLYLGQLVVQTTWTCTARCAMCYQSAGPKGSDVFGQAQLSLDDLAPIFEGLDEIALLEPHFHIVGGEPLIDHGKAAALTERARGAGFDTVSLTTNGFWGRARARAAEVCAALVSAGLTRMDISWDRWRRPFIAGEAISTCIEEAARCNLPVKLRLLLSTEDTVEDLLGDIRPGALRLVHEIYSDTVAATGRAATRIAPALIPKGRDLSAACFRDLRLTINPAGDVYPCCAGLDQTRSLLFGNIRETPLAEIVRRMDASPLLRRLVFDGVSSLLPVLPDGGARLSKDRSGICSLCWALFSDTESVEALKRAFPKERWAA